MRDRVPEPVGARPVVAGRRLIGLDRGAHRAVTDRVGVHLPPGALTGDHELGELLAGDVEIAVVVGRPTVGVEVRREHRSRLRRELHDTVDEHLRRRHADPGVVSVRLADTGQEGHGLVEIGRVLRREDECRRHVLLQQSTRLQAGVGGGRIRTAGRIHEGRHAAREQVHAHLHVGGLELLGRRLGDRTTHGALPVVLEETGRVARRVADDLAVLRIRSGRRDPRDREGPRVDEAVVEIRPLQVDRSSGAQGVELRAVRDGARREQSDRVPVRHLQPLVGARIGLGVEEALQGLLQVGDREHGIVQRRVERLCRRAERMHVAVVDAGHDRAATRVDDLSAGSGPRAHGAVGSHLEDASVEADRHRGGTTGPGGGTGVDPAADDDGPRATTITRRPRLCGGRARDGKRATRADSTSANEEGTTADR